MRPDVRKPEQAGWMALGAAALLGALVLAVVALGEGVGDQLAAAKKDYEAKRGKAGFARLIADQRQANEELARTIGQLKHESGMSRNPYFIVPPGTQQKGYLWRQRFIWVHDQLSPRAHDRHVLINEDLGFGHFAEGPSREDEAEDLLAALQLVQKAVSIALSNKDSNFVSINVAPDLKPILSGIHERPLLREFALDVRVVGSLTDILTLLHRFSLVESPGSTGQQANDHDAEAEEDKAEKAIAALYPTLSKPSWLSELSKDDLARLDGYVAKHDYPLITTSLVIESENVNEALQIQLLTATFRIAGMRFLSDEERAASAAPLTPGRSRPASSPASEPTPTTTAPAPRRAAGSEPHYARP